MEGKIMAAVKIVIKDIHKCTEKDLIFTINMLISELVAREEIL